MRQLFLSFVKILANDPLVKSPPMKFWHFWITWQQAGNRRRKKPATRIFHHFSTSLNPTWMKALKTPVLFRWWKRCLKSRRSHTGKSSKKRPSMKLFFAPPNPATVWCWNWWPGVVCESERCSNWQWTISMTRNWYCETLKAAGNTNMFYTGEGGGKIARICQISLWKSRWAHISDFIRSCADNGDKSGPGGWYPFATPWFTSPLGHFCIAFRRTHRNRIKGHITPFESVHHPKVSGQDHRHRGNEMDWKPLQLSRLWWILFRCPPSRWVAICFVYRMALL